MAISTDKLSKKGVVAPQESGRGREEQEAVQGGRQRRKIRRCLREDRGHVQSHINDENRVAYLKSAKAQQEALQKFLNTKDLSKQEAKSLKRDIDGWISTLKQRQTMLAQALSHPDANDVLTRNHAKELDNFLDKAKVR